jgi:hypothetical protein
VAIDDHVKAGTSPANEFLEVAICEAGVVRSAGRVKTMSEALELFARSLEPQDRVALEVTGGAWEIARILEGHVRGVVVVSPDDTLSRKACRRTTAARTRRGRGDGLLPDADCVDRSRAQRPAGRQCQGQQREQRRDAEDRPELVERHMGTDAACQRVAERQQRRGGDR